MSVHAKRLDHASVRITDLARSRAFYEGLLGLETAPRPELGFPGVWYDLKGSQVHLIEQPRPLGDIDPTGPHFALEVADLEAVKRLLDERGIRYVQFGDQQLWVQDPDGNVIELCTPR
jgi:glyoxylase I family protein